MWSTYFPIIMLLFIILWNSRNDKQEIQKLIIKRISKKKVGIRKMNEIIKEFIGKECIIYTFQTQIIGVIERIQDNWIYVKSDNNVEIINLEYISRIREYPRKKNGKKKSIFT